MRRRLSWAGRRLLPDWVAEDFELRPSFLNLSRRRRRRPFFCGIFTRSVLTDDVIIVVFLLGEFLFSARRVVGVFFFALPLRSSLRNWKSAARTCAAPQWLIEIWSRFLRRRENEKMNRFFFFLRRAESAAVSVFRKHVCAFPPSHFARTCTNSCPVPQFATFLYIFQSQRYNGRRMGSTRIVTRIDGL